MTMFESVALLVEPLVGVVDTTDGAESVVNCQEMSGPGWSGGSLLSSSVTSAESTVTVHSSPSAKSLSGFAVHVMWSLELRTLVCEPEPAHEMLTAFIVTASVHVIVTFEFVATLVAVSLGDVDATCGLASMLNEKL